ncbi:MAG: hypothetical protein IT329_15310 [Caldilineaceae bacterium]|nr:hypothetical protein [Caldilineaceae bacterium]
MISILERVAAVLGALVCLVGAALVAAEQASIGGTPGAADWLSLWPLPGLALLEWGLLGLAVFVGVLSGRPALLTLAWAACGALAALVILGAFSIGPAVLLALIFLTAAVVMASVRRERNLFGDAGIFLLGTLANFALFALLLLLENIT